MAGSIKAVAFDLYGTLMRIERHSIHREIPRAIGIAPRMWMQLVREKMLTVPFADARAFVHFACEQAGRPITPEIEERCIAALDRDLASVSPIPGAKPLLTFLRNRGLKLGLVSNVSSTFKDAVFKEGMDAMFDAMLFSCDEGCAKPDPAIYHRLAERLGVDLRDILFIGDSQTNDVDVPRSLGMRAIWIGGSVQSVAELGWTDFNDPDLRLMLRRGDAISGGKLESLESVGDEEQGRYNLVYRCSVSSSDELYAKRFLLPESAAVEELAHRIYRLIDMPSIDAKVMPGPEPWLLMSRAAGTKFDGNADEAAAYEIGRHHTFAYLFANADLRPRNLFIDRSSGKCRMTLIDLEHCFFNLAIETEGIDRADDPHVLDAIGEEALRARISRTVLTDRAMTRCRRSFLDTDRAEAHLRDAFRAGFADQFREVQRRSRELVDLIEERLYRKPYIIIGTRAYRRAMAKIDLEDIAGRLKGIPEEIYPLFS